jgi:hypothetical protein
VILDVRFYDGRRIEWPLPDGATWLDAREALAGLRRDFSHLVRRAEIIQPPATPVLERLDRTLVGAP